MDTRQAYNLWATQYDTNDNKTRDLEAHALRKTLANIPFGRVLEVGCGTGKNTQWLVEKAEHITAVDLSEEMLAKAKQRITALCVQFQQTDITTDWAFAQESYNLITFSLVLEHIQDLDHIFREASRVLQRGGYVYVGELHPFKQYSGSKARFDTAEGRHILECFNHNLSDFIQAARQHGLVIADIDEYFDDDDRNTIPRILTILFTKL
ncbi:Methyltransferase domain-containing protein [Ohtaekwangia koreensis]|uniref:Methyltransferase domain-containing protein n=2 Tax=Ohtaekwangia koreensis TaxID=688867 RepID=A0A1T5LZN6_9BACT|nr:Methyltransferase domain-containing protein [Ohtaekwangia koreensis]